MKRDQQKDLKQTPAERFDWLILAAFVVWTFGCVRGWF